MKKYLSDISLILLLLILLLFSCNSQTEYLYKMPESDKDGWETTSLSNAGMDTSYINRLMNYLLNHKKHYLHSILIVKDGKLVLEEYFSGKDLDITNYKLEYKHKQFDRSSLHYTASVSKSITALLVGIAIDRGLIQGVNENVVKFFPEQVDTLSPKSFLKNKITIEHMLLMASGIPWSDFITYDGKTINSFLFNREPIQFNLSKDLMTIPGSKFSYNNGTTDILGDIVRKVSQKSLINFAEQYLFSPLGISSYVWVNYPNAPNVTVASGGLYLCPRDMAKIGQLCLEKGVWNEKRIISKKWIESSIKTSMDISESPYNALPDFAWGYGYHWWLVTYAYGKVEGYSAAGWGNQLIIIIPQVNIVVVMTGGDWKHKNNFEVSHTIVNNYILPSLDMKIK